MSFLKKSFGAAEPESAHSVVGMQLEPDSDDPIQRHEDILSVARFLGGAEIGDPKAQTIVAVFFADGKGAPQDYVEAYKWAQLAATQGIQKGELVRQFVIRRMTRDQILEGERRAKAFVPERLHT